MLLITQNTYGNEVEILFRSNMRRLAYFVMNSTSMKHWKRTSMSPCFWLA